ncbi:hypothetical protein PENTCL1PPCAC_14149 [Pristionchus entomophagus]|uniref:Uncharacterized protein n=1 Tax=Pristionchus entomophagus TaxID=358040 RepID=A0AAV5TA27_9BILA|nr:hypothetical protein PENTCL1PPCAC_14149 [Pristionchus entomophagus]
MRFMLFILASTFIVAAKTTFKGVTYQIQGVEIDEGQQGQYAQAPDLQRLSANGFSQQQLLQQQQQRQAQLATPKKVNRFHQGSKKGSKRGTAYYYPPRQPHPLPTCFHNPTGYVCCNEELNDLMVDTYTTLEQRPKFHACS